MQQGTRRAQFRFVAVANCRGNIAFQNNQARDAGLIKS
jgi:hypothetical protein